MGKLKQVDSEQYDKVRLYLLAAIADGRILSMVDNQDGEQVETLSQLLNGSPDLECLNEWMNSHLSLKGRERLWNAMRSLNHQAAKPNYRKRLNNRTYTKLENYAKSHGLEDIEAAVLQLLDLAEKLESSAVTDTQAPRHTDARAPNYEGQRDLTESQAKSAWQKGEIACLSVNNQKIRILFKGGVETGTIVTTKGDLKSYKSDSAAWKKVDELRGEKS